MAQCRRPVRAIRLPNALPSRRSRERPGTQMVPSSSNARSALLDYQNQSSRHQGTLAGDQFYRHGNITGAPIGASLRRATEQIARGQGGQACGVARSAGHLSLVRAR